MWLITFSPQRNLAKVLSAGCSKTNALTHHFRQGCLVRHIVVARETPWCWAGELSSLGDAETHLEVPMPTNPKVYLSENSNFFRRPTSHCMEQEQSPMSRHLSPPQRRGRGGSRISAQLAPGCRTGTPGTGLLLPSYNNIVNTHWEVITSYERSSSLWFEPGLVHDIRFKETFHVLFID